MWVIRYSSRQRREKKMTDYTHLNALENNLFSEECRLAKATAQGEIELRTVWVAQLKREIAGEKKFLGIENVETSADISADDLLEALVA